MCAYTNVNKCCGFNKIIIIIQTFCCNRMWLHEMSSEKCFYHYRAVADSQVSSGEEITIKEGCRKRHFWYKSQGSSHFACFKLSGHFSSQAGKRVIRVVVSCRACRQSQSQLSSKQMWPLGGRLSSSQQPPPAGLTSSPGSPHLTFAPVSLRLGRKSANALTRV